MLVPLTPRQTADLAGTALASGRGAGLPELLELIKTLASRLDRVSLGDLSDLIEQDPVVSARLINMANLIVHNPGMTSLSSVTHAIHQIGFQRVRSLAISLLLLKSSGARQNPAEQRQAASRALCAALVAQACARQLPAVDAEMVFACAALRELGRILLPVVSLEHYRAALELARTEPEANAFRRWFGLTPLELSRELLKGYKLSPEIRRSLGEFRPGGSGAAASHDGRLTSLAEYGRQLSQVALDAGLDAAGYRQATTALATAFAGVVPASDDFLAATLNGAGERLAQFAQTPGASSFPDAMLRRLRARLPKAGEPAEAAPAPATRPDPSGDVLAAVAELPPPDPAETREAAAESRPEPPPELITLIPETVPPAMPVVSWPEVLRPVRDGFAADDCVVFLRAATGSLTLRHGLGTFAVHHQDTASVHPAEKTVFSIALGRRETVVIHDSRTPSLTPHLPPWFRSDRHTPAAFLLVPLIARDRVEALVLAGWSQPRRIEVGASHEALLHLLRTSAAVLLAGTNGVARTGT